MAPNHKTYLFGLRGTALEWGLIVAVIFPAYTVFGWNNGIAGSQLSNTYWEKTFPLINTSGLEGGEKLHATQIQGTVVATYTLGALFGAISCIWIGDPLGRRKTMALGAIVSVIGVILETSAFSVGQLVVGRLVEGIGFGALSATAPNWQTECSTSGHRGSAVVLESMFISLGLALQGWISLGFSYVHSSASWRVPIAFSIFWCTLVVLALPFVPESPRWLIKHGRNEEAREVLSAIEDKSIDSAEVNFAMSEIEEKVRIAGKGKFADIFKMGELRLLNRVFLASAAGFFQQFCGINALAFYQTTIFETYLGVSGQTAKILAASVFTWQTLCSPIGVLTVDRFGRRKLMLLAEAGMGCSMAVIAGCSSDPGSRSAVIVAGVFIFMFSLFFPIGFLGLAFLYASEISPLEVRVYITSVSTAVMTPAILAQVNGRYYILYAAINLFLVLPVVYFCFPETNGRTLEEIDEIFSNSKNIFQPVKFSRDVARNNTSYPNTHLEKGEDT
ncbi:general substrate transporter [Myriangium duriaei CBS 260.36]|uniref:General substrate transporter n=1 Tax=Myriangium duriaei CBS 260.36 TaxID=1168546 RepID=A0A9P4J1Y8_9PEZI|nr:general substrate transporter [Myriangium duriaei CBS 260.36]